MNETMEYLLHRINWPPAHIMEADEFSDEVRRLIRQQLPELSDDEAHQYAVKIWKMLRGE